MTQQPNPHRANNRLHTTTALALGLTVITLSACTTDSNQPAAQQAQTAAPAEPAQPAGRSYDNHIDATLDAARQLEPGLASPSVTKAIVIFTDPTGIDLRVQVQANRGFCEWFGVNADLTDTGLRYRSGHVSTCDQTDP